MTLDPCDHLFFAMLGICGHLRRFPGHGLSDDRDVVEKGDFRFYCDLLTSESLEIRPQFYMIMCKFSLLSTDH